MNENPVRELEWFDLETRLREIIYQQLEIFNKKAREDRENHSSLSNNVNSIEKRLALVEGCVFGETAGTSVLGELKKKISDVEGARKRDMVRFDQEVVGFKERFKTVSFQINGNQEMIKRVEGLQEELSKDIQKVKELAEEHQKLILKEIENINVHFKEMNANYLDKGLKLEEKMNGASAKMEDIILGMQKYDRQFEGLKKNLNDIYINMTQLKSNKVELESYESEHSRTESKLQELTKECQDFRSCFAIRDSFIDKFIPIQTFTFISDAMHYSMDPFSKKRLAEYENVYLKELHQNTLDVHSILTREEAITKVLENIRHVEQRKTEILIEKPKEQVSVNKSIEIKSPIKNTIQEKYHENYMNKEDMISIFEKLCESKIEPMLNKSRIEFVEKYDAMKKNIITSENECMLYTQQVLREVEDLKGKEIKDLQEVKEEMVQIREDEDNTRKGIKEFINAISGISQMLVCLVENAQIDLALTAQEEETRLEASESSILRPRVQENLTKRPQNYISGNMLFPRPQQSKTPPLMYRARRFLRNELVEMKGKMLKLCWDSVSKSIPWRQDEFEFIISEAVKSLKLVSSEESQAELTAQQAKDTLPSVISPSLRTRTPHGRKFKL